MVVPQLTTWKPIQLRGEKIQGKLKVVQVFGVFTLYHLRNTNDRPIPPIEYWRSIVHRRHVDKSGKQL